MEYRIIQAICSGIPVAFLYKKVNFLLSGESLCNF